ncbi:MAG TPA: C39 family peptidase [Anaerolineae bacterium]|nr:C39 family peptidase [Anaerolineae bacterium]
MGDVSTAGNRVHKPLYHLRTDLFRWHQYQGRNTNDCAAFSAAIVCNALLDSRHFDGYAIAREMEKPALVSRPVPHITIRKIPKWATLPWGIAGYLRSKGIRARLRWLGTTEDLLRNIQEDRPTIVIIGEPFVHDGLEYKGWGHAKVLYGFEPTGPQPERGFYFIDPGYPKTESHTEHPPGVFRQGEAEFMQQWRELLRLYVEAEVQS